MEKGIAWKVAGYAGSAIVGAVAVAVLMTVTDWVSAEKVASALATDQGKRELRAGLNSWITSNPDKLLDILDVDDRFKGKNGSNGKNGATGPTGPAGMSVPIGSIVAWPFDKDAPDGWEICDGDPISVANCDPKFVDLIGTTYGAAGPNQVKLPDFQGAFLRGQGTARDGEGNAVEHYASEELGTLQLDAIIEHTHNGEIPANQQLGLLGDKKCLVFNGMAAKETSGVRNVDSKRVDYETRPVNYAVHWIIRVR